MLIYFLSIYKPTQQTQNMCITFVQRRPNVFDVGPTLYKWYTNILCLLGYRAYVWKYSKTNMLKQENTRDNWCYHHMI